MRLLTQAGPMAEAFAVAANFCGKPTTPKPILRSVLCHAGQDGAVTLTATDLEQSAEIRVEGARVEVPGMLLLPGDRAEVLFALYDADTEVSVGHDDGHSVVRSVDREFRFASGTANDFPAVACLPTDGVTKVELTGKDFARLAAKTAKAASTRAGHFGIDGVHFSIDERGHLRCMATDTTRVMICSAPAVLDGPPIARNTTVPAKPLHKAAAIFKNEPKVAITFNKPEGLFHNRVWIDSGKRIYSCPLISGRFPSESILESRAGSKRKFFAVAACDLYLALDQVSLILGEDTKSVGLEIEQGEGRLGGEASFAMARGAKKKGSSLVSFNVDYDGPLLGPVLINPTLLMHGLTEVPPTETVRLSVGKPLEPVYIKTDDSEYWLQPFTPEPVKKKAKVEAE